MSPLNKYLMYGLSLLAVLSLNIWFLNGQKYEVIEAITRQDIAQHPLAPQLMEEVQYMTIRFNPAQRLDAPLIDKAYNRNGRAIEAASDTVTPRGILSLMGKNGWDVIHVSQEGAFLLRIKKKIDVSKTETKSTTDNKP